MDKFYCNTAFTSVYAEARRGSELVSQLLYGENVRILAAEDGFFKIIADFDQAVGWVEEQNLSKTADNEPRVVIHEPYRVVDLPEGRTLLSMGCEVPPAACRQEKPLSIADTALLCKNVPYLRAGRSFFGVDAPGFVQLVYKSCGIFLPRWAAAQSQLGTLLDFLEESLPGDLAFFENEAGKITHVGIMVDDQDIIHAHGKVRIDTLDSVGIYNADLRKHTHKLRFVRRVL